MPEFTRLTSPSPAQLPYQFQLTEKNNPLGIFKDAFRLDTILVVGALVQTALLALLPWRVAVAPAILYAFYRMADTSLQAAHITPNQYTQGTIPSKYSAQLPNTEDGSFGSTPAAEPLVVFLLAARFDHPLGIFAPGAQEMGHHSAKMMKEITEKPNEFGMLGASAWTGTDRADSNTMLTIMYFRNAEGLNKFAHSDVHRRGWDWYNRAKHSHIAIMHESFSVPAGGYESIYKYFEPTLLAASSIQVQNQTSGESEWVRPIVSAEKGVLKTSFGRRGRSDGKEHEKYDFAKEGAV